MKKSLALFIGMTLAVLFVTGCGASSSAASTSPSSLSESSSGTPQPSLSGSYTMATAGTSGTFYPYGGALCQIVNKAVGVNITATATGGGKENIALLTNEETDFALLDADMMSYALTGTSSYEGKQVDTFSSIASLFPQVFQVVVSADSEIHSIADLKGKRVSVGDAGSGSAVNAAQVFRVYGIEFDDIKVNYLSFKESASAFQDNTLDAFVGVAGIPTTAVTEASLVKKVRLLSIDDEHMKLLTEQYPFFAPFSIESEVYQSAESTQTIAIMATVAALKSVDEQVVYEFTKAMFEHMEELGAAHAKGRELSLEQAINGLDSAFLHPGAAKYYREVGILK